MPIQHLRACCVEHHVFLSYSRKDTATMQRLRDDLRAEGLLVWTDENLTPGTESWKASIATAIEGTGSLIVLLSPDAKQSPWVNREIDYARTQNVRVFPMLARGDDSDSVPFALIDAQYVDIRTDYAANLPKLLAAVCDHLGIESNSQRKARLAREAETARQQAQQQAERDRLAREERERQAAEMLEAQHQQAERDRLAREERERQRRLEEIRNAPVFIDPRIHGQPTQTAAPPQPTAEVRYLTPWNPLDQVHLLWWVFITPQKFAAYKNAFGDKTATKSKVWLASTITWLPLLIPMLAYAVDVVPPIRWELVWSSSQILIPVALGWFLTGLFGDLDSNAAFGVAIGVAVGVARGVVRELTYLLPFLQMRMGDVALEVVFIVPAGVAIGVAVGMVRGVVRGAAGGAAFVVVMFVMMRGGLDWLAGVVGNGVGIEALGVAVGVAIGMAIGMAGGVVRGVVRGVASGVASGVAFVVAGGVAGGALLYASVASGTYTTVTAGVSIVAIGVAIGMAGVVALGVGANVEKELSPVLSKLIFAALIFSYAVLIWIYWLGGWKVLTPA